MGMQLSLYILKLRGLSFGTHTTLKVASELIISEVTSLMPHHKKHKQEKKLRMITCNNNFNIIGKTKNQTSVSDTDRKIQTLGSTDNAGTR